MIQQPLPRMGARRALLAALLIAGAAFASCSDNDAPPTAPGPEDDPPPANLLTVIGNPRVAVTITGQVREPSAAGPLTGIFRVVLLDSIGRRIFVPDVRINGFPMIEEPDPFGSPNLYTLDIATMTGLTLADTVRFEVVDGGDFTPPFQYLIVPSHVTMPGDSVAISAGEDLVLTWTGVVERMIINLTDLQGKRLRVNLQVENYSGISKVRIPARDLAELAPGELQVGTDILDTELRLSSDLRRQQVSYQATQSRVWTLVPVPIP